MVVLRWAFMVRGLQVAHNESYLHDEWDKIDGFDVINEWINNQGGHDGD
jgi:hypothetical protein